MEQRETNKQEQKKIKIVSESQDSLEEKVISPKINEKEDQIINLRTRKISNARATESARKESLKQRREMKEKFLHKFTSVIEQLKTSDPNLIELRLERKMQIPLPVFSEFMKALYHNTYLKTLELVGIKLGESGALSLANCLKENKTIILLLLSRTMIGERGAQYLLKGIQHNIYITSLIIEQDNAAPLSSFAFKQLEKLSKIIDQLTLTKMGKSTVYKEIKPETRKAIQNFVDVNNLYRKFLNGALDSITLENRLLKTIPSEILESGNHLTQLNLSRNRIQVFPKDGIEKLVHLKSLILFHNKLTEIPEEVGLLTNLKVLDLSANSLKSLPNSIGFLNSLEEINLTKNSLTELPKTLGGLPHLKSIEANRNPLKDIPKNIHGNTEQLLSYIRNASKGSKVIYNAKLMFMGGNSVGKTSLINSLKKTTRISTVKPFLKNSASFSSGFNMSQAPTEGIQVSEWAIESKDLPEEFDIKEIVTFNCWDFGGKKSYHGIHQFFMTNRALYLVVFSLIEPKEKWNLTYWLQAINLRCNDAPIILVGTHLDNEICTEAFVQEASQEVESYHSKFPNIQKIFFVSCSQLRELFSLKDAICELTLQMPWMKEKIPNPYETLRERVKWKKRQDTDDNSPPLMKWEEWRNVANSVGIFDRDVRSATIYLHNLGEILYFDDVKFGLNDVIILDPQWITSVFTSVVNASDIHKGILLEKDLDKVWLSPYFPPSTHELLLTILLKFEVAVRLPNIGNEDQEILIADLLPEERPSDLESVWLPHKNWLKRIYSFNFLPIGFMSKLIVRIVQFSKMIRLWKEGALVSLGSEMVLVQYVPSQERLYIECRGTHPIKLLSLIDENIANMIVGWDKDEALAEYSVFIPCHHCEDDSSPYLFPFENCEDHAIQGKPFIYCEHPKNEYPIGIRLDTLTPELVPKNIKTIDFSTITFDQLIGSGGFSAVFKGKLNTGQIVAIKKLTFEVEKELLKLTEIREKNREFRREVTIMSELDHPNIIKIIGISYQSCIVTELLEYGNLTKYLENSNIPFPLKYRIAYDIAAGMSFLHSSTPPLVHRDLKSPNILIASIDAKGEKPVAKITDFGTSRKLSIICGREVDNPTWLAPEVMDKVEYGIKSDVYGYAIILWELITQEVPFQEFDIRFTYVLEDRIKRGLRPTIPNHIDPKYKTLIEQCWHQNPNKRPTFQEIYARLTLFDEGTSSSRPERKSTLNKSQTVTLQSNHNAKELLKKSTTLF